MPKAVPYQFVLQTGIAPDVDQGLAIDATSYGGCTLTPGVEHALEVRVRENQGGGCSACGPGGADVVSGSVYTNFSVVRFTTAANIPALSARGLALLAAALAGAGGIAAVRRLVR